MNQSRSTAGTMTAARIVPTPTEQIMNMVKAKVVQNSIQVTQAPATPGTEIGRRRRIYASVAPIIALSVLTDPACGGKPRVEKKPNKTGLDAPPMPVDSTRCPCGSGRHPKKCHYKKPRGYPGTWKQFLKQQHPEFLKTIAGSLPSKFIETGKIVDLSDGIIVQKTTAE